MAFYYSLPPQRKCVELFVLGINLCGAVSSTWFKLLNHVLVDVLLIMIVIFSFSQRLKFDFY